MSIESQQCDFQAEYVCGNPPPGLMTLFSPNRYLKSTRSKGNTFAREKEGACASMLHILSYRMSAAIV